LNWNLNAPTANACTTTNETQIAMRMMSRLTAMIASSRIQATRNPTLRVYSEQHAREPAAFGRSEYGVR
jgi:hypothetical protein